MTALDVTFTRRGLAIDKHGTPLGKASFGPPYLSANKTRFVSVSLIVNGIRYSGSAHGNSATLLPRK